MSKIYSLPSFLTAVAVVMAGVVSIVKVLVSLCPEFVNESFVHPEYV